MLPYADYEEDGVIISAIGANCGQTWLARGKWSCIKNTMRILAKPNGLSILQVYFQTKNADLWPKRGSAQPFISQTDARALKILAPSSKLDRAFANKVIPLLDLKDGNLKESELLKELRDALLPELLAGRISPSNGDLATFVKS
jgi:type I restriction enzyme S subunit